MQKLTRTALFVLGGVIVVLVALVLGLNLYVQSQGTQARIEQELQRRLGTPLTIQRISVTPWAGLILNDITIPSTSGPGSPNLFEAKSVRLRVGLFSLFSSKLVIKRVSLVDARVFWTQDASGKWRLPRPQRNENPVLNEMESPDEEAQPDSEPEAAPSQPEETRERSAIRGSKPIRFVPEVRQVNLKHADFRFLNRSGTLVAAFENVGFHSNLGSGSELHGSARVDKVSLRDRFFLENLTSPLEYDELHLVLSHISARAGGGDIAGSFSLQPETEDSPFTVEVKFRNVDADRLITDAGGLSGIIQGRLEGSLQATGKTADGNSLTGTGEILLRDGQIRQYSLLVALGQIFQIEELTQLHLEQAEAKYHMTPGVVNIDQLTLRSPNIHLSATGTVTFGGKLHLDSRLAINEKIRSQLFKPIRANFQPTEEPGYSAVDFEVGGTIERPKTNLLEKVVGRDLKDLVNSLWGGKAPRPKKKKPAESETQQPASSPVPSATAEEISPSATATPAGSP